MKGLVIATVFALGIAVVGCSQQDGKQAAAVPRTVAAPVADATPTNDQFPAAPAPVDTTAADTPEPPVAPARTRQVLPRGRGFVPLDDPSFLTVGEAGHLGDEELVLGVEWAGEVRAYPVRMLRYHHVVNDTVGGEPLLVTY